MSIEGCGKLFVLTTFHGILEYYDGSVYLKGGQLSLQTHDGQSLQWVRLYFKNGLQSLTKSWDCCLIEIEEVFGLNSCCDNRHRRTVECLGSKYCSHRLGRPFFEGRGDHSRE